MTAALLDHLWQSTLFALMAGLATLYFRNNGAGVRYGLWLAASLKFLFPFALLTLAGRFLLIPIHPDPKLSPLFCDIQPAIQPFLTRAEMAAPDAATNIGLVPVLAAIWALGFAVLAAVWLKRWWGLRRVLQLAIDAGIAAPVPVKYAPGCLEPGLVGIFRPVLLLPQGISLRLSPEEMRTVIAHELCHLRRRDNLTAALHMIVEALVWFHPLVWWIGARLIAERERACDESVLGAGANPETYAQGILKVCRYYLRSPLTAASGVSGADLKQRLSTIMENKIVSRLTPGRRMTLGLAAIAIVIAPLTAGLIEARLNAAQAMAAGAAPIAANFETPIPPFRSGEIDRYAGYYQRADGAILRVIRDGGRYFVEEPGHRRVEFFPGSRPSMGAPQVAFEFDAAGKAARVIYHRDGGAYEARRIGRPAS